MTEAAITYAVEQLKWALQAAKAAGDYGAVANIATQIASVESLSERQ